MNDHIRSPEAASDHPRTRSRRPNRLSLLVAACLLVEAVVAKEVLDVRLDYVSQFAPLWVYVLAEQAPPARASSSAAVAAAVVAVTVAVLVLYAV